MERTLSRLFTDERNLSPMHVHDTADTRAESQVAPQMTRRAFLALLAGALSMSAVEGLDESPSSDVREAPSIATRYATNPFEEPDFTESVTWREFLYLPFQSMTAPFSIVRKWDGPREAFVTYAEMEALHFLRTGVRFPSPYETAEDRDQGRADGMTDAEMDEERDFHRAATEPLYRAIARKQEREA